MKRRHFQNLGEWVLGAFLVCATVSCAAQGGPKEKTVEKEKMVIRVLLEVKPEKTEAFVRAVAQEEPLVKAMEGCQMYTLFAAPDSPTSFILYEEWENEAAFKRYQASDLLKKSFQVLGPMLNGPPNSAYFKAAQVGPS